MPLLLLGKDPTNVVKSDPTLASLRITHRTVESGRNFIHLGAKTGALTGVSANAPVFQLQNQGVNLILIKRVKVCFSLTTAFGAAQYLDFGLIVARGISVYGSGGTSISLTGNAHRLMTDGAYLSNAGCRIATTGTLTTGTRTLDSYYLGQCGNWMGAIGAMIPLTTLFEATPGKYYLTLAQNEGIEIAPVSAFGATGVGVLGVNIEFCEVPAY